MSTNRRAAHLTFLYAGIDEAVGGTSAGELDIGRPDQYRRKVSRNAVEHRLPSSSEMIIFNCPANEGSFQKRHPTISEILTTTFFPLSQLKSSVQHSHD